MNLRKYEREQKKADLGDKKISSRILGEPKQTRKGPNHYSIQDIKDCKGQLTTIHPISLAEPFTDMMKFRPRSPSRKPFNKAQSSLQPSSAQQQLRKAVDALARAINNLNQS